MGSKLKTDYFADVNTKIKAYWLGFFFADGGINGNRVGFCLSNKDYELLVLFCKEIGLPVSSIKKVQRKCQGKIYDTIDLHIYSQLMAHELMRYGCTERKTHTIRLPKLDDDLYKAFLVGYYDGDGCCGTSTICCGNKDFLQDIRDKFSIQYPIKLKTNPYGQCYILNIGRKILRECFKDFCYGLERKRYFKDNGVKKHWSKELANGGKKITCPIPKGELQKLVINSTLSKVAKELNVGYGTVWRWCREMEIVVPSAKQRNINNRKFEIDKEQLKRMIGQMSYVEIGKVFGVSDNSIRKRAKLLGIL